MYTGLADLQASGSLSSSSPQDPWDTAVHHCAWLHVGSGDLDAGPDSCVTSPLPSEPSSRIYSNIFTVAPTWSGFPSAFSCLHLLQGQWEPRMGNLSCHACVPGGWPVALHQSSHTACLALQVASAVVLRSAPLAILPGLTHIFQGLGFCSVNAVGDQAWHFKLFPQALWHTVENLRVVSWLCLSLIGLQPQSDSTVVSPRCRGRREQALPCVRAWQVFCVPP